MFHNASQFFSIAIGIVGLLGGAVGYLSKARQQSILSGLTKDLIVTKDYNKTLENQISRLETERDGYKRQYEDTKELAQGSPQLIVVAKELKRFTTALGKQTQSLNNFMRQSAKKSGNVSKGKP